jgi:CBS domain-containing protein|tara:strand:+ start:1036 stop:1614 length:579 start_codon:yes stop_codon:yes gene_type:complete
MLDGYLHIIMEEPKIADMSIADEHIVVASKTRVSAICQELSKNPDYAVLVKKGSDIIGIVTARDIFAQMAEGLNATKIKVDKIMRKDILTLRGDTPLSKGLNMLSKLSSDAVIVTDNDGEYLGYFSVKDYREATRKLESHQLLSARLSRSRKAISRKAEAKEESGGDLLDLLLGENLEEEDDQEFPSMISLD